MRGAHLFTLFNPSIPTTTTEEAGFCDEYQAIYDTYASKPDDGDAEVDNTWVAGWVADGVWAKLDGLWVFANHAAGADSLRNWLSPASLATAHNAPAWVQWQGYTGGTNEFINLNWIPSVDGINYVQNSASFGVYVRNDGVAGNTGHGILDGVDLLIWPNSAGNLKSRINDNATSQGANADRSGMFILSRTAAAVNKGYRNKVEVFSAVSASTGLPTENIYILACNDDDVADSFAPDQVAMAIVGAGLTQGDIDNITDRFETRMDFHGTGVIP